MTSALTEETFTPNTTQQLLQQACDQAGLTAADAVLLRHQTNAVYLLPTEQVVVKISRPSEQPDDVARTLTLVRWLSDHGVLTIAPTGHQQPQYVRGCLATFWPYVDQDGRSPVTAGDLGQPLHALHQLTAPLELPALEVADTIQRSVASSRILSTDEKQYLASYCTELAAAIPELRYELPEGLIHEDPQHHNALQTDTGTALIDWDGACIGPREWDLVTIEIHCRRFFDDPHEYTVFTNTYGIDIRDWSGYATLRDLRELRMITTNARKSPAGSPAASEVHSRISQLRQGDTSQRWRRL
ncbi:phosphotransferase enzyme family protein [Kribbella sp. DT2]|uniref:phosphotransferase enzyme family protein n=1 Tax=Kribbella sp. DT2 TaxID=3393427 RepID=UPI003CE86E91